MTDTGNLVFRGSLNFSTSSEDHVVKHVKKPKTVREPMSHRMIEKRRRDRMNNCLADLSRLIPVNYFKQGQGRIEKTEIIEMAIKHIKYLTNSILQPTSRGCECTVLKSNLPDRYLGFKECQDEVMRYLVEVEGWDAMDKLCTCLMAHLEQAGEKFRIMNDETLSKVAKEEQYRHADEEMGTHHKHEKPRMFDVRTPGNGYHPVHMSLYQLPAEQQGMVNGTAPVPQEYTPIDTLAVLQSFSNSESTQQITRENLNRDKNVWPLLQTQYNTTTLEDSGVSTDPGSSSSNNTEDKLSVQTATINSNAFSEIGSANSSSFGTLDSSSEKNGGSIYKFKHNITQRFSLEKKKGNPSDTSLSTSSEDKVVEKGKRKFRHVRSRSPIFRNAEAMNSTTASNEESGGLINNEDVKMSNYLPGFVLHPIGTHYIPVSIHPSSMGRNISTENGQNAYHPISISVNFGGPLLYVEKVSINSDSCASLSISSTNSPVSCSGENSSICNSENSPSSAQDGLRA